MASSRQNCIFVILLLTVGETTRMATPWPLPIAEDESTKQSRLAIKTTEKVQSIVEDKPVRMDATGHCRWSTDKQRCDGEGCVLRRLPFDGSSRKCRLSDQSLLRDFEIAKQFLELESDVLESDSQTISSKCDKLIVGSLVSIMRGHDCARRLGRSFQTINFMMKTIVAYAAVPAVTDLNVILKSKLEKVLRNLIRIFGDDGSDAILELQRKLIQNPRIFDADSEGGTTEKVMELVSDIAGDDGDKQEAIEKIRALPGEKSNNITLDIRNIQERFDEFIYDHNLSTDERVLDEQLSSELESIEKEREMTSSQSSLFEFGDRVDSRITHADIPRSDAGRVVIKAAKAETTVPAYYRCNCRQVQCCDEDGCSTCRRCDTCWSKAVWNGRFKPELQDSLKFNLLLNDDWLTIGFLQQCLDKLSDIGSNMDGVEPILSVFKSNYRNSQAWKRVIGILVGALAGVGFGVAVASNPANAGAWPASALLFGTLGWLGSEFHIDEYRSKKFRKYEQKWGWILRERNEQIRTAVAKFSDEIGFDLRYEGSHFLLVGESKARHSLYSNNNYSPFTLGK